MQNYLRNRLKEYAAIHAPGMYWEPEGFIPGYQCAGRVTESRSSLYAEGDLIFCTGSGRAALPRMWEGHTTEAVVHEANLFRLPPHAPLKTAALAKLAAIALHGIRIANFQPGERVAVVGLGPVGFFSAAILQMQGMHPLGVDLSAARCDLFRSLGGSALQADPQTALNEQIQARIHPDVVIDATGVPALLNPLLLAGPELPWGANVRQGLRLIVQGSYPDGVTFDYDTAFTREVTLLFPRDNTPNDLRDVLSWICDGRLRLPPEAVTTAAPDAARTIYRTLRENTRLSTVFKWDS